ncbi:MaoC family dehydratase [Desertimonas flava]|uniref:MaoC family dehydratase n=1 Tax=Desertimonas flava TaxID=2064846 RepID=UPI0013C3E756|nr:MaoC family dehydratase [Desertimonas flava]
MFTVERIVPAAPDPCHWGMLLVPNGPAGAQPLPDDAMQVYARLRWRVPVDALRGRRLRVATSRRWVSVGPSNTEVADVVIAHDGYAEVASALLVSRTICGVPDPPQGVRALPPSPAVPEEVADVDLTVCRARVTTFATVSGITHPLHCDRERCRRAGFADLVVQGLELLDDVVRAAGPAAHESAAWFRRPVVAGERLTLLTSAGNTWAIRAADGELAMLARTESGTDNEASR